MTDIHVLIFDMFSGVIFYTFNGLDPGPTWLTSSITNGPNLYCVAVGGKSSLVAVTAGQSGGMYKTTNGGI